MDNLSRMRFIKYTDNKGYIAYFNLENLAKVDIQYEKTTLVFSFNTNATNLQVNESVDEVMKGIFNLRINAVVVTAVHEIPFSPTFIM